MMLSFNFISWLPTVILLSLFSHGSTLVLEAGIAVASDSMFETMKVAEDETATPEVTNKNIPGERIVRGRVTAIRSEQIIVDVGNPEPLYLPLKPALDKGLVFHVGGSPRYHYERSQCGGGLSPRTRPVPTPGSSWSIG